MANVSESGLLITSCSLGGALTFAGSEHGVLFLIMMLSMNSKTMIFDRLHDLVRLIRCLPEYLGTYLGREVGRTVHEASGSSNQTRECDQISLLGISIDGATQGREGIERRSKASDACSDLGI